MDLVAAPTLAETEVVFAALAHAARRHIVQMLSHYGDELPSGYLAQRLPHSWPTTTRHLSVLVAAGVIEVRREGRSSFYRIDRDRIRRVIGGWLGFLEPPSSTKTWRSSGRRTTKG
ncbi:MAG: helix-turn-helix domain-containing protein [Kofleriaceae bacterium]